MLLYNPLKKNNPSIDSLDFVVLDFETTGVNGSIDEIVEIGAVRVSADGRITDKFSTLTNPGIPIPPHAMHIHGITDQDVLGQPEPWQAISELIQFSKDALMVAHNARFDGVFLQKYLCQMAEQKDMEFENADNLYLKSSANFLSSNFASPIFSSANSALKEEETVNWQGIAVLDTVTLARHIFPGFPSYSLMNLKKRWGIQTEREHRGLDDAMAAAKILIKCLKKIKEASLGFYFQELWMVSPGSFISGTLKPGKKTIKNEKKMRFAINNAIYHNETIAISYQDLTGVVTKREVTPLRLFYNYTEQYLEAFCHLRNDKRLFRLERMKLS